MSPPPRTPARSRRPDPSFFAVSEHLLGDGTREALELGPNEVVIIRERDGKRIAERVPLSGLRAVRTRARVGRLELLVALSYLLGASVFLYLIVSLIDHLTGNSLLFVLGILAFFAAGGVAAAWFGQEAVLQFVSRGRRKRVEYHLDETERDRMRVLEPFTRTQRKG